MAEGDGSVYYFFKESLLIGHIALGADSLAHVVKVMLVTGHTLDTVNDEDYADVSADECSGTGYTAGGETLGSQTVTNALATKFDGADVTWSSLNVSGGGDPNYAIMYDSDYDVLMFAWEIATATNGGNWTLQWHADGIATLT